MIPNLRDNIIYRGCFKVLDRCSPRIRFYNTNTLDTTNINDTGTILITGIDDNNITDEMYAKHKTGSIDHWFAQNVMVKKPDLHPLPIGVSENITLGDIDLMSKLSQKPDGHKKWLYVNFTPSTNPEERERWMRDVTGSLVTKRTKKIPYADYLQEIQEHKFVLSPPGNGFDCFRTWETLYLGSFPIVKRSAMNDFFASFLPIVVMDDFSSLTVEFLVEQYKSLLNREIDYTPLRRSFWEKRILGTIWSPR